MAIKNKTNYELNTVMIKKHMIYSESIIIKITNHHHSWYYIPTEGLDFL